MSGYYCTECGALYAHPGHGVITCGACGALGLRCFYRRPRRVSCAEPECAFSGWYDGGINDDLPGHLRRDHGLKVACEFCKATGKRRGKECRLCQGTGKR